MKRLLKGGSWKRFEERKDPWFCSGPGRCGPLPSFLRSDEVVSRNGFITSYSGKRFKVTRLIPSLRYSLQRLLAFYNACLYSTTLP